MDVVSTTGGSVGVVSTTGGSVGVVSTTGSSVGVVSSRGGSVGVESVFKGDPYFFKQFRTQPLLHNINTDLPQLLLCSSITI